MSSSVYNWNRLIHKVFVTLARTICEKIYFLASTVYLIPVQFRKICKATIFGNPPYHGVWLTESGKKDENNIKKISWVKGRIAHCFIYPMKINPLWERFVLIKSRIFRNGFFCEDDEINQEMKSKEKIQLLFERREGDVAWHWNSTIIHIYCDDILRAEIHHVLFCDGRSWCT